ncbi:acid phosphatase/Vanadium-dependent haloperoxidase [Cucurbitaria berberidis CBS 394.84]|uniref:Acid phosphatase/Vanadium-dependent haloperoxidase n=1 Tax=Cucurbitaria berberidis CBS 394.84 TaxID=1168544 RepID=A0A9P4GH32_9PLEO|nr:acid phosphatase/Vanadium-dependent haloperoxidase [Cucurbitaria berberidis CBS 394.84]KAF1845998.1 acid phosphatase/Vanadium-dependent haloperoxidase [Cucurbitaria berberidis CBS 394.84]
MMKLSTLLFALSAGIANAEYSGDIVQYWVDQSGLLSNNSLIGGLQSPPSGWFEAVVQAAIYVTAVQTKNESLAFQQLAVSHAAHDSLTWTFHGTRNYGNIFKSAQDILVKINISESDDRYWRAAAIGRKAAIKVTNARQDDKLNNFVNYVYNPATPGVYQRTPGSAFVAPDTPQARYLRTFSGLGDITRFRAPPPPAWNSSEYEAILNYVKAQGEKNSTVRTPYNTETAYFWRESSTIQWNRVAHNIVGNRYAKDVLTSAKFYLQVNYALANAAIAGWDSKAFYNSWRPVTAIRRTDIWLPSGKNEYISTHAIFGGAAAAVIKPWNNGSDTIDILQSTNGTGAGIGVIMRRYKSLKQAVKDNGDSRIFGGIHFQFSSDVGKATVEAFEKGWDKF